ncbi:MAG TPA: hypothetical protein VLK84_15525, partial [Longimicrobium sp.]|nr:hypothetical protein [Longimicrobium sp.]
TIAVTGSGAQTTAATRDLVWGFGTEIVGAAGRIYGDDGSVVDAERRVRVGSVSAPVSANGFTLAPDPHTGRLLMLTNTELRVYDLTSLRLLGRVAVPGQVHETSLGWPDQLVRFGTDGVAFYDTAGVVLVRSPLIAP